MCPNEKYNNKQVVKEKEIVVKENIEVISVSSESDSDTDTAKSLINQSQSSSTIVFRYVGSVKKLIVALNQRYSETSNYMDIINASSPTTCFKPFYLSEEQSMKIKDLIKQRYQSSGGMCKPIEVKRLKVEDQRKLQEILDLNLIHPDLTMPKPVILTENTKKVSKKRFSYTEAYPSDNSEDEDYSPIKKKPKNSDKQVKLSPYLNFN